MDAPARYSDYPNADELFESFGETAYEIIDAQIQWANIPPDQQEDIIERAIAAEEYRAERRFEN